MADYTPVSGNQVNAVRRVKDRAHYDEATINSILDVGLICHVAFQAPARFPDSDVPEDHPFVIPMAYGRIDRTIYLHGYVSGRLVKQLSSPGSTVCITVTHVDGLVMALSAMHHSMEYRSAIIFGSAQFVVDEAEKVDALKAITNHATKIAGCTSNRWDDCREATKIEMKTTSVIRVEIKSASAKIRNHGVKDDLKDLDDSEESKKNRATIWTGVIPVKTVFCEPVPTNYNSVPVPDYIAESVRKHQ